MSPSNQNNKSDNARVVREAYDGNIKSRRKRYSVIEDEHEETVLPKKKLQHIHNLRINQTVAGFYERPEERVQRIDKLYLAAQGLKKEKLGIS